MNTSVLVRVFRSSAARAWTAATSVLLLWWSRVFTVPEYFERTLALGWYPPGADSIDIPMAESFIATVFATPFVILALWLTFRKFPTHVPLLAWSDEHIGSSLLVTAAAGLLCYFEVTDLVEAVRLRLPLTVITKLFWIATWIALRAILISRAVETTASERNQHLPR